MASVRSFSSSWLPRYPLRFHQLKKLSWVLVVGMAKLLAASNAAAVPESSAAVPEAPTASPTKSAPKARTGAASRAAPKTHAAGATRRPPVRQAKIKTEDGALPEPSLMLSIKEDANLTAWRATLVNIGSSALALQHDPRLLWFELKPVKGRSRLCRLPKSLRRSERSARDISWLEPGASWSFSFDPRFYCFSAGKPKHLKAGVELTAHYGWETAYRKRWRRGKLLKEPKAQEPPFVAHSEDNGSQKEAIAAPLTFQPAESGGAKSTERMQLSISRTSDAASPFDATVSVTLKNTTAQAERLYIRSELLSFVVSGPEGKVYCAPEQSFRAPGPQSLTHLAPGKSRTLTVRLNEFCPSDTLSHRGAYYVRATYDTARAGLDAEELRLTTEKLRAREAKLLRLLGGAARFRPTPPLRSRKHRVRPPPGPGPKDTGSAGAQTSQHRGHRPRPKL